MAASYQADHCEQHLVVIKPIQYGSEWAPTFEYIGWFTMDFGTEVMDDEYGIYAKDMTSRMR